VLLCLSCIEKIGKSNGFRPPLRPDRRNSGHSIFTRRPRVEKLLGAIGQLFGQLWPPKVFNTGVYGRKSLFLMSFRSSGGQVNETFFTQTYSNCRELKSFWAQSVNVLTDFWPVFRFFEKTLNASWRRPPPPSEPIFGPNIFSWPLKYQNRDHFSVATAVWPVHWENRLKNVEKKNYVLPGLGD